MNDFASAGTAFHIEPLTAAQEPIVWEMLYYAIHVPDGEMRPPRSIVYRPELARYAAQWGKPEDMGVAAWDRDVAIGAAWLRLLTGENKGYGYIDETTPELSIALFPAFRGKGIGTLLLTALLAQAAKHFSAVSLSVSTDNAARRLYERFGFVAVGLDGSSITMLKRLK
jgi:ribosomal protein S18 acetylase RimI-like enzyme